MSLATTSSPLVPSHLLAGTCPVTTDLIMRVNVRTTNNHRRLAIHRPQVGHPLPQHCTWYHNSDTNHPAAPAATSVEHFFLLLIPSTTFALFLSLSLSRRNSHSASPSRLFSPLSTKARAFFSIARRFQTFLLLNQPRNESRLPTQLAALSSRFL